MKKLDVERVRNSLYGFVVADALGVPVEFALRHKLQENPVSDFIDGGTHNVPAGSWSDDSSLMLCLAETLAEDGVNFELLSEKMINWMEKAYMTPFGKVFDIGKTTLYSLMNIERGKSYLESGEKNHYSNGNGSLMRILPFAFYPYPFNDENTNDLVSTCSAITHAHDISKISCCIYIEYFHRLIETEDKIKAYQIMQKNMLDRYKDNEFISCFDEILKQNIYEKPYDELVGHGFVVDTLKVVLHCFINGDSYKDCILKAINLGEDTDTNGAITGGLAGYFYNYVPIEWKNRLLNKSKVDEVIDKFCKLIELNNK